MHLGSMQAKAFASILPLLLLLTGCQVSGSVAVSVSNNGTVTTTGTINIKPNQNLVNVSPSDLHNAPYSGYTVIVNAPTSNYTYDTSSTPQATLTATTDQGYTSSMTVNLTPVEATTQPVASGYAVYAFEVPNNSQVQAWTQQVAQHATSSLSVSSNVNTVFNLLGNAGTYTFYAQVNSSQTGLINGGSATYTPPTKGSGCVNGKCPVQ